MGRTPSGNRRLQRTSNGASCLGQGQLAIAQREAVGHVGGRLHGAAPGLEPRVLCAPGQEVGESLVQMAQRLLQRHVGDFTKLGVIVLLFQQRQASCGLVVIHALLCCAPSCGAHIQRPVVHVLHAAERASQLLRLLGRRVEAIAVGAVPGQTFTLGVYSCQTSSKSVSRRSRYPSPP